MEIKLGSVVWLNSGGPSMTACVIDENANTVACRLIRDDGQLFEYVFPVEALRDSVPADHPDA